MASSPTSPRRHGSIDRASWRSRNCPRRWSLQVTCGSRDASAPSRADGPRAGPRSAAPHQPWPSTATDLASRRLRSAHSTSPLRVKPHHVGFVKRRDLAATRTGGASEDIDSSKTERAHLVRAPPTQGNCHATVPRGPNWVAGFELRETPISTRRKSILGVASLSPRLIINGWSHPRRHSQAKLHSERASDHSFSSARSR